MADNIIGEKLRKHRRNTPIELPPELLATKVDGIIEIERKHRTLTDIDLDKLCKTLGISREDLEIDE